VNAELGIIPQKEYYEVKESTLATRTLLLDIRQQPDISRMRNSTIEMAVTGQPPCRDKYCFEGNPLRRIFCNRSDRIAIAGNI
jgi:hypothetical protein